MEDILEIKIGQSEMTLRQANTITFLQWMLKKVSDSGINNNYTRELNMFSNAFPGGNMADENKREIIDKMIKAGITI